MRPTTKRRDGRMAALDGLRGGAVLVLMLSQDPRVGNA